MRELVAEYRFADIDPAVADQRGGEAVQPALVR